MLGKVFVLCSGERDEGHSPVSVYNSLQQAKRGTKAGFVQSDWVMQEIKEAGIRAWKAVMPNGIDEEWIYHLPVHAVAPLAPKKKAGTR